MREIQLTKGKIAIVDDDDYEALSKYNWCYTKNGNSEYAKMRVGGRSNSVSLYMHRVIMSVNDSKVIVDHKDGNGLNNSRQNIRTCDKASNQRNKRKKSNASSQYLGVTRTMFNTWKSQITHNRKNILIGTFKDEREAALAYNKKKIELHGEFSQLNKL